MRPHELRDLLESRRECVATEAALERITALQQDLDLLENIYEDEIKEILNGTGYNVQSVFFSINIVREIRADESSGEGERPLRRIDLD